MRRLDWAATIRVLSLLTAAFFVAASVLQTEIAFGLVTGQPPGGTDFLDERVRVWAWENGRWPMEFAATALFALGFFTFAGLGVLLARLGDAADARRPLMASAFLGAGGIGAASQLIWLGVKPFATQPHYCDCNFLAEEVWSRMVLLDGTNEAQLWLLFGAILLAGAGMLLVAGLGWNGGMPTAWFWLSMAIALAGVVTVVLGAFRTYPLNLIAILVVAGVLVPIWAVWLAIRAPILTPADAAPLDPRGAAGLS